MYKSMFSKVFGFIRTCDVAIEVVDARNIEGTRTSKFDVGLKDKLLMVATKADLLPPDAKRIKETHGIKVVYFSSRTREGLEKIFSTIRKFKKKGNRRIAVTIFGIPNVGKSTLINVLRGKHVAQTGFKPGITRGEQWINIGEDIRLMDTPGVFLKGESEPELAARGAMEAEKLKNPELAARTIVEKFIFNNNDNFFKYYKIEKCPADEALEAVAKKRGLLLKGGELNIFEAAKIIVREFQKGKFVL